MRVLIVGGTGTIGTATVDAFEEIGDEVISVSRSTSPGVDITAPESMPAFFDSVGTIHALVSITGKVPYVDTAKATPEDFSSGFANKLGGQINLVLAGIPHIAERGSFTLTTGILAQHSVPGSVIAGTVNGGIEAFVKTAALELPLGIRINAVSPTIIEQPNGHSALFRGFHSVTPEEAAQAYVRSAHGIETGQVFRVW
ncbi:short chain dehydrogenase [Sinomonas humi]|uniref:Short-chain dehydrogenase n=1 Tax=Sinomonas humi TaxID=1338436 RepID=A0A0B2ALW9_9MICC|nr:short chain dehydrogenase [Sinomonas humi]KHL02849.1 short-chain dehydrogenase [Sinomonas humi]